MVKLVMKDLPLMEAPTDRYPAGMGDLIDVLATYENKGNALGYSVYYYAEQYVCPSRTAAAGGGRRNPFLRNIADATFRSSMSFTRLSARTSRKTDRRAGC